LRLAQQVPDLNQKARLLEMAHDWQRLAEAAAKRENQ
jgi:hypothetical protein